MATTLAGAFSTYRSNLEITDRQETKVSNARANIVSALKGHIALHDEESKLIGSYDRRTLTRLLCEGDVDVMVILNYGKHKDWYTADGTIKCLDKFKEVLSAKYPQTDIRRDRNCITMKLSEFRLDVVPAFKNSGGDYQVPDSIAKSWLWTNPKTFAAKVTAVNKTMGGSLVPLIKMVKGWNREVGWPIRSFHLECMMLNRYSTYTQGYTYSSMLRYWFEDLPSYLQGATYDPVRGQRVDGYLDNAAQKTRRQIALDKANAAQALAKEAHALENSDVVASIKKWKALLGDFFPSYG